MKHDVLYLEIDDEITSVAEKVRRAEGHEVVLVVPKNAVLLQSIVNLKLLAKAAAKTHKRIAVVTADKSARNIVFRAGLPLMARVSDSFPEKNPEPVMPHAQDEISLPREGEDIEEATERDEDIGDKKIRVKTYAADEPDDADQDEDDVAPKKSLKKTIPVIPRMATKPVAHVPLISPKKEEKLEKIRALQSRRASAKRKLPKSFVTVLLACIGLALVVVIGVLYFVLPKATVIITPKTEPASATVNVPVVATGANAALFELNGTFIETDKKETKSFPATGQKDFGKKAQGSISFSNSYSSAPQVLAAGTKFQTTSGLTYILDNSVSIPGATVSGGSTIPGVTSGPASAEKTGDAYNIGSKDLIIVGLSADKKAKILATTSGFSGGSQDIKKVVQQSDIDAAKKSFEGEVKDHAKDALLAKVATGLQLLDGAYARAVKESSSSVAVNDAADTFDYTVSVHASGLAFDEAALKELALKQLATKLTGKNFIDSDAGTFTYQASAFDLLAKRVIVATTVNKTVVPAFDLGSYVSKVQGKTEAEVRDYFAPLSEISSVRVEFWPFYVHSVPKSDSRVTIRLDTK